MTPPTAIKAQHGSLPTMTTGEIPFGQPQQVTHSCSMAMNEYLSSAIL
jgi:hypothetical protein